MRVRYHRRRRLGSLGGGQGVRRRRRRRRRRHRVVQKVGVRLAVIGRRAWGAACPAAAAAAAAGGRRRRPGPLLDDGFALRGDDLLRAPVQLRVLNEAVAVREPGATLLTAVGLLALERRSQGKRALKVCGGGACKSSRTYFAVKKFLPVAPSSTPMKFCCRRVRMKMRNSPSAGPAPSRSSLLFPPL